MKIAAIQAAIFILSLSAAILPHDRICIPFFGPHRQINNIGYTSPRANVRSVGSQNNPPARCALNDHQQSRIGHPPTARIMFVFLRSCFPPATAK